MGSQTNAIFLRELDFAKFFHYSLTGIHDRINEIKKQGGSAFQGASWILPHCELRAFTLYKVETQIIWWDENAIYLQQKFSNFHATDYLTVISKQQITKVNVVNFIRQLNGGDNRPHMPKELGFWINSMKVSSKKLRKIC